MKKKVAAVLVTAIFATGMPFAALAEMPREWLGDYALDGLAQCAAPAPFTIREDGFDIAGDPENRIACRVAETFPLDGDGYGMVGACRSTDDGSEFAAFFNMRPAAMRHAGAALDVVQEADDGAPLHSYRAERCG